MQWVLSTCSTFLHEEELLRFLGLWTILKCWNINKSFRSRLFCRQNFVNVPEYQIITSKWRAWRLRFRISKFCNGIIHANVGVSVCARVYKQRRVWLYHVKQHNPLPNGIHIGEFNIGNMCCSITSWILNRPYVLYKLSLSLSPNTHAHTQLKFKWI